MNEVTSIWLLLSWDAVRCCHEPDRSAHADHDRMPLELLSEIAALARARSWTVQVLTNAGGLPSAYGELCRTMDAQMVIPARCQGTSADERSLVVFEADEVCSAALPAPTGQAVLRIRRANLGSLAERVSRLAERFSRISIRHPELLSYEEQDLQSYRAQLFTIAEWLIRKGAAWSDIRVDRLTDRFQPHSLGECGAGRTRLAVGPTGEWYLCPAAAQAAMPSYGHVLTGLRLPNRHLLRREYSLPCGACGASHCLRCVYQNKCATYEFCVPPKNMCVLSNYELEVQAWLARQAVERQLWNETLEVPELPSVYDPFELVNVREAVPVAHAWRRLLTFDGQPKNLTSSMMLDITHGLDGWCRALLTCAEAGVVPAAELLEHDVLTTLRRQTIERYRDVVLQKDCPSVHEIERSMCRAAHYYVTYARRRRETASGPDHPSDGT